LETTNLDEEVSKELGKKLYDYQEEDLNTIFDRFHNCEHNYNLLYQLPTGGGKTVIFSEIARRYIKEMDKKVLILTHRIELCNQTSNMLGEFGVTNKIINSQVKELPDQDQYKCFVAMVETLNNRLQDEMFKMEKIGLVIIDEAHYNSFRKLFKYFEECFILGVTATPLSSNRKLPMHRIYKELIVGSSIDSLIGKGFLAKATTFTYDVRLGSLKVGINGDYTVKSSEELYSNSKMQNKLLYAYEQRAKGKKTLIFNAGIATSQQVYYTFKDAKYPVRHLDSTVTKQQRKDHFLDSLISDEDIERNFRYKMPEEMRVLFGKTKEEDLDYDIEEAHKVIFNSGKKTATILENAAEQHANIVVENSENLAEALGLIRLLDDAIEDRVRRYCYCICNSTKNYRVWAQDEYKRQLKSLVSNRM